MTPPLSIQLERSQIISVANAEMRARKQSRLAQTAQASVGLGAAAGSAVVVGGVVGLLPTVALLAGMPVVAPGISVSAFKHIFNYGQVALELTLHSNTRRKAKLENAKLVGMLDGKKNV